MDIVRQLLLQVVLILLNAFFAATEIAVISLNEKKLKAQADEGDKKAKKMLKMVDEPTAFLSTIQIGITLAGFLGSAFAADNFAERMTAGLIGLFPGLAGNAGTVNTISIILITLILSFFTLVLGELVPKRVAMRHKEKIAEYVCGLITALSVILKPIIWLLTVSTNGVLRLFGIDPHAKDDPVSKEDIVLMLDAGADEGSLDQNDIDYIKNIFKQDRLTAEDVMTPRKSVVFLSSDATPEEILDVIRTEGYSRIPVYGTGEDNVIGILHARDFLLHYRDPGFTVQDILVPPTFAPETINLDLLFKEMQTEHTHLVIVVNEFGETAGVVTLEDILEEIVGEIWDERDEAVEDIVPIGEDTFRVLSTMSVENFFDFFGLEMKEDIEATTVNGWLTELSKSIPDEGYTFDYENLTITVTKADDIMTHEIEVVRHPVEEETEEDEDKDKSHNHEKEKAKDEEEEKDA